MAKEILKIRGMYCENCARRIETGLQSLDGISVCKADYAREEAEVVYDSGSVSRDVLCRRVRELGYDVAPDSSRNIQIASILTILLALYLIANHLGLLAVFNIFPTIEAGMSYGAVFLVGLLTSAHCIAMCGGINLTQSVLSVEKKTPTLRANLLYNIGRVVSYTLIGGIVGAAGGVVSLGGKMKGLVVILAGLLMLVMAFRMLGIFRGLRKLRFPIPTAIYRLGGKLLRGRSSFAIGILNGLMPCGPLQSMQFYALSTGSFAGEALAMLLFSLGTVPLMLGFGALSGRLNRKYARYMLTVSALLIFVLGLGMLGNGLSLSGVSFHLLHRESTNMAVIEDGRQFVRSEVDYGSYEAITVRSGIPVEWTIHVPEGRLNGCNGEILIQEYGLDIKLHEGDNLVSFNPENMGTVAYSCWMGMIRSSIHII